MFFLFSSTRTENLLGSWSRNICMEKKNEKFGGFSCRDQGVDGCIVGMFGKMPVLSFYPVALWHATQASRTCMMGCIHPKVHAEEGGNVGVGSCVVTFCFLQFAGQGRSTCVRYIYIASIRIIPFKMYGVLDEQLRYGVCISKITYGVARVEI